MPSQINASNSGFGGIVSTGDSSGVLQLQTTGTTALTIDTSQNVGIGTTSPAGKLDITKSTNGSAFVVNAPGGTNPNFIVSGSGEQTFRLYNSASTGSTRTSIKLASRLNTDWEWIVFTDAAGTGINDLTISNLAGEALKINSSRNLQFNSGYGSVATAYGCRAWAKFNGVGVIANSGNVSSVTKVGTGNYAVNFTTAMPDVNYSAVATADIGGWNTGATQTGDYQTTFIGIQSRNLSMTATDATVSVAVFR